MLEHEKTPDIRIFQIFFNPAQVKHLDKEFVPFDNCGQTDPLLEVGVFRRLYGSQAVLEADLWGAVSWKFTQKSGVSAAQWLTFIKDNPGHDVYFCNPNPEIEALFENPWIQGESAHPNFLGVSHAVLKTLGFPIDFLTMPVHSKYVCTANYFVGNHRFWGAYNQFLNTVCKAIENLPPTTRKVLCNVSADPNGVHNGATYLPFFMERLFGLFLAQHQNSLSSLKLMFEYPSDAHGQHLENLRCVKDHAVDLKSNALMKVWSDYRKASFSITPRTTAADWFR
ncbi:MAG: hypothetical protein LW629_10075 [Burkholderiales bacterium]|jgi:hypothetical protein|nr:hypothetical protein [Burkholderiales bacterium]